MMYKGWIAGREEDRKFLEQLGVKTGIYSKESKCFEDCYVSSKVFERLDKYWGRFFWGLKPSLNLFSADQNELFTEVNHANNNL